MLLALDGLVRAQWSFDLAQSCQVFAGTVLDPEPEALLQAVSKLAKSLPAPASHAEKLMERDRLRIVAQSGGHQFHAQFHRHFPQRCDQGWKTINTPIDWQNPHRTASQLLNEWANEYLDRFANTHQSPVPIRAARVIRSTYNLPFNVDRIARQVGYADSGLIRSFKSAFGVSMGAYNTRRRIRRGMELLRDPESNVGGVAFKVGFLSTKNFYRAVRELTGLTPTELRRLSDQEAEDLLARCLNLPTATLAERSIQAHETRRNLIQIARRSSGGVTAGPA